VLSRIVLIVLFALSTAAATAAQVAQLREDTAAIAAGADSRARRQAITDALSAARIEYRLEEFMFPRFSGTDIVVDVSAKTPAKTLLVGAHYDRVAVGQGAVDNASSCAVLLELLTVLKANPMENISIRAVFFDLEESGLVGSQAYLAAVTDKQSFSGGINLDIFGYGNTIFATTSSADGKLAHALETAAKDLSMPVRVVEPRQYPASDHRSMMNAGIETLGLALIDGKEIDPILQRSQPEPRILTIIHTPRDTMENIRPEDMEKAYPVIEKTLRLMDET